MSLDLRTIARALGGEVQGRQVLAPGPNHSRRDRSLSVRLSAQSPTGYIVFSHAGDDFRDARDYVAAKLGLGSDAWRTKGLGVSRPAPTFTPREPGPEADHTARIARAVAIWGEGVDAHDTVVERYLTSRGLDLPEGAEVLRYHPRCPWRDETENRTMYVPAMVAALRQIQDDVITGIHRTRLTPEGAKVDRRMLGLASSAAVKLDADDTVTTGLTIGEGVETVQAARQLGFRPGWALGSAGAIAAFPILGGIESLTILAEHDDANRRAADACAGRWHAAGREVIVVEPTTGSDILDAMRGAA